MPVLCAVCTFPLELHSVFDWGEYSHALVGAEHFGCKRGFVIKKAIIMGFNVIESQGTVAVHCVTSHIKVFLECGLAITM